MAPIRAHSRIIFNRAARRATQKIQFLRIRAACSSENEIPIGIEHERARERIDSHTHKTCIVACWCVCVIEASEL